MDVFDFNEDDEDDVESPPSQPSQSPPKKKAGPSNGSPAVEHKAGAGPPRPTVPVKLSASERLDNLNGMLDGVGQTSSLALRKQKALELARTCSTPYLRALLRQGTDVPMVEKVMDTVAAAMSSAAGDEETSQCLCGAVYFLLKDRSNIVYIKRALVGALVRLLKASEESKAAASREPQQQAEREAPPSGGEPSGKVPKFARKRFHTPGLVSGSAVLEDLKQLLREEEEDDDDGVMVDDDSNSNLPKAMARGGLALSTLYRMLRDPQLLDEEEDREEDGFESDSFGRTPSFSRRRHSMSGVLTETPSSETNDLPLDQGDEGPGSVRWSLKEHIRTEGGLAVLVRLVQRSAQELASPVSVQVLSRGLDLLETLSYLNHDNQRYLTTYRSTPAKPAPQQQKKKPATIVQVLLDLVREVGGMQRRDRPPVEVQLAMLRVLVNLTHHNGEAIDQLMEHGGLEVVVGTLVQHLQAGGGDGVFDAKLLGLNVLTNCAEVSAQCRVRMGALAVVQGKVVKQQQAAEPPRQQQQQKGGEAGGAVGLREHLVSYLQQQIEPFAEHLDREMTLTSPGGDGRGAVSDPSDSFEDKHAEHLVLAAYTSLLLGCLMRDNPSNRAAILAALPNHSPRTLIRVLKAFLAFQKQVGVLTSLVLDPIIHLIHELEHPSSPPRGAAATLPSSPPRPSSSSSSSSKPASRTNPSPVKSPPPRAAPSSSSSSSAPAAPTRKRPLVSDSDDEGPAFSFKPAQLAEPTQPSQVKKAGQPTTADSKPPAAGARPLKRKAGGGGSTDDDEEEAMQEEGLGRQAAAEAAAAAGARLFSFNKTLSRLDGADLGPPAPPPPQPAKPQSGSTAAPQAPAKPKAGITAPPQPPVKPKPASTTAPPPPAKPKPGSTAPPPPATKPSAAAPLPAKTKPATAPMARPPPAPPVAPRPAPSSNPPSLPSSGSSSKRRDDVAPEQSGVRRGAAATPSAPPPKSSSSSSSSSSAAAPRPPSDGRAPSASNKKTPVATAPATAGQQKRKTPDAPEAPEPKGAGKKQAVAPKQEGPARQPPASTEAATSSKKRKLGDKPLPAPTPPSSPSQDSQLPSVRLAERRKRALEAEASRQMPPPAPSAVKGPSEHKPGAARPSSSNEAVARSLSAIVRSTAAGNGPPKPPPSSKPSAPSKGPGARVEQGKPQGGTKQLKLTQYMSKPTGAQQQQAAAASNSGSSSGTSGGRNRRPC